jgi:multidrug transporter EmrE-like cation transporter
VTRTALSLILLSVTITAFAQLMLKAGMSGAAVQRAIAAGPASRMFLAIVLDPLVMGGLAIYFLAAGLWLFVLSKVEVSLAYPFLALGFVLVAVFGRLVFQETLSPARIAGTLLICGGVALIARS